MKLNDFLQFSNFGLLSTNVYYFKAITLILWFHRRPRLTMRGVIILFNIYANVQISETNANVTYLPPTSTKQLDLYELEISIA